MAKIEITGSPEELERVAIFLRNNNIKFDINKDYKNYSAEESKMFDELINKFS